MSFPGVVLALLIGVSLGFFGGGGSILTVPLLVYVFGLEPKQAIASSLLVVGTASASGAIQHWRAGNIELRMGLLFGFAGVVGAYFGGRVSALLDGTLLLLLFAGMMILTSTAMWRGRRVVTAPPEESGAARRLIGQGFAVGLLTGLIGAGGGFLIVPALTLWAGLPMPSAVGTSLLIITLNTFSGFVGYQSHVTVDYSLIATVATSAVIGSFVGSRLTRLVEPDSLRRAFAGFVLAAAGLILFEETETWLVTARSAVPSSLPQLVFALLMLGIGVAAGRVSRPRPAARPDPRYQDGAGI